MSKAGHSGTRSTARQSEKKKPSKYYLHNNYPELVRSDVSIYPSYTNLTFAYDVVCRQRFDIAREVQNLQFTEELLLLEKLQSKALDGVRVRREFSLGILSHKLPPKRYIDDPLAVKYTSKKIGHTKLKK